MINLNKCCFVGRVGQDPEVKALESGKKVASFSIAVNESYKDKSGQWQELTEWVNLESWVSVEFIEKFIKKGDIVYIEGKFFTKKFEKDGQNVYRSGIRISEIKKDFSNKIQDTSESSTNSTSEMRSAEDDLPF